MYEQTLFSIKQFIEDEIMKELKNKKTFEVEHHNHPPLKFLVPNCEFCKKHGNIYCE